MENHFEGWFYCWYLSKLQKVIAILRNIVRHLDKYEGFFLIIKLSRRALSAAYGSGEGTERAAANI